MRDYESFSPDCKYLFVSKQPSCVNGKQISRTSSLRNQALTQWLQLADKLTHRTCLLARTHDLTSVARVADKSTELIVHARHEWPIKRPLDYQPWKDY